MATRRLPLDGPLDLAATLAPMRTGRSDPTWRLGPRHAWRALRTPGGPATMELRELGDHVRADAWGPGAPEALDGLAGLVGPSPVAGGRPDPLAAAGHDLVRRAARTNPGLRTGASAAVVATAVATVLGQRVTGAENRRSWAALVRTHGEPAPGPGADLGLMLPPAPGLIAGLGYAAFHPLGVERGRAETIIGLCRRSERLESLTERPLAEAARILSRFRGVGPWTTSIVAGVALGDPDAPVVGDLHVPHHIGFALEGTRRSSDERMLELLAPYTGHRTRAQRLVLRSSRRPPRRAPRRRLVPMARR